MGGAAIAVELLEVMAELLRKRPADQVLAKLHELEASWPAPIGEADLDAAVKAGLDQAGGRR